MGADVRAAISAAAGKAAAAKADAQARIAASSEAVQQQVGEAKAQAASGQEAVRRKVRADAQAARTQYAQKQEAAVARHDKAQGETLAKADAQVGEEKRQGDEAAAGEIEKGDAQIADKQSEVEGEVAEVKQEAQAATEEKGFFGRLGDDIGAWFDEKKKWISDKVEAGKKWIKETADKVKKAAAEKIDAARDRVTGLIKDAGDALIAASDTLLADFPAARDAVRGTIESGVELGVSATNAIAEGAKTTVNFYVDTYAAAADAALDVGGKVATAAIDGAKKTTVDALNAADKAAQALGVLKVLVEDVASNPGGWIGNLGASARDGVQNHLAAAMKAAIKQWWEGKLESVLGIGTQIWEVLKKGGLGLKEIGAMAWSAIKAAIPPALIQLIIEKVVAMIIPAAGAVMAIIEGLQAAWGSVSAMLGAVGKAIGFLKAVKGGGAGPQFAQLVAAAAIVVIDFVSNWLLLRLGKAILKIGGKIKGIAQKLMKKVSAAVKKFSARRKAKKAAKQRKKARDRRAKQLRDQRRKKRGDKDGKDDPNKKKQEKETEKRERLKKALAIIQPAIEGMASGKPFSRLLLKARLLAWKIRFRLSTLTLKAQGTRLQLDARINPSEQRVLALLNADPERARGVIYEIAKELFKSPAAKRKLEAIAQQKAEGKGKAAEDPIVVSGGGVLPAVAMWRRQKEATGEFFRFGRGGGTAHVRRTWGGSHSWPGKQWVAGAGKWRDVDAHFDEMAGEGGTRRGAAGQLLRALRGQAPTAAYADTANPIARQAALIAAEGSRSSPNIVMLPEMVGDVAEGHVKKPSEALGADRSPAAAEGDAVKTMREADRRMGEEHAVGNPHQQGPSEVRVNEVIAQQINFLANKIVIGMKTKQLTFKDDAQLRRFIKNELQDWLQSQSEAKLL